jgi:hypothetical protein
MRRRIATAACAVLVVAVASVGGAQKVGAVGQIPSGGGALTMTLSATSGGTPLLGGFTCTSFAVSGTGVLSLVSGDGLHAYAGPVTLSGSFQPCGDIVADVGPAVVNVSGDPAFGDLRCGSATNPDSGELFLDGAVLFGGWAMFCEIGGQVQGGEPIVFTGVAGPTSIEPGAVDAFTVVGSADFLD